MQIKKQQQAREEAAVQKKKELEQKQKQEMPEKKQQQAQQQGQQQRQHAPVQRQQRQQQLGQLLEQQPEESFKKETHLLVPGPEANLSTRTVEASVGAESLAVGCSASSLSSGASSPPCRGTHDLVGERQGGIKGAAGGNSDHITSLVGPRQTAFALAAHRYGRAVPPDLGVRGKRGAKTTGASGQAQNNGLSDDITGITATIPRGILAGDTAAWGNTGPSVKPDEDTRQDRYWTIVIPDCQ